MGLGGLTLPALLRADATNPKKTPKSVIYIVLSGGMTDGVAGLLAVRAAGGVSVVQDPRDAKVAVLPQSAREMAGADHIVPPALNKSNARHYHTGIVAYKEFPGRAHYTLGQDGWEEVADYALDWALNPQ